jgi:hypothetical protein
MLEYIFFWLGLAGAAIIVSVYWMLQNERMSSRTYRFYMLNATGSFLIAISIAFDYDPGDIGGIVVEISWVIISVLGMIRHWHDIHDKA